MKMKPVYVELELPKRYFVWLAAYLDREAIRQRGKPLGRIGREATEGEMTAYVRQVMSGGAQIALKYLESDGRAALEEISGVEERVE